MRRSNSMGTATGGLLAVICDPESELDCAFLYHGRSPLGEMKGAGYARSHKSIATSLNNQYYVNLYTDYKWNERRLHGSTVRRCRGRDRWSRRSVGPGEGRKVGRCP